MEIYDSNFDLTTLANMNGDFHGDGANSIAGVIYTNSGDYRGGFVGSETLLPLP